MCVGEMISVDKVLCFFKCEDFFFFINVGYLLFNILTVRTRHVIHLKGADVKGSCPCLPNPKHPLRREMFYYPNRDLSDGEKRR